jgi:cytochrome c-type biogenesis protein CcmH/NrfG
MQNLLSRGGAVFIVFVLLLLASHADAKVPDNILKQQESVVTVYINDKSGRHVASGKGFIVSEDGIIATNCRVVSKWFEKAANMMMIELAGGIQYHLEDLISKRCDNHLVLIKIEADQLPAVKLKPGHAPKKGEKIVAVRGAASKNALSEGTVMDVVKSGSLMQTSIPVALAESGAPVFNMKGEVIGAAVYLTSKQKNLLASLPKNFSEQINNYRKHKGSSARGGSGIRKDTGREPSPNNAEEYFQLGCNYESSNMHDAAIKAYKNSLRLDPGKLDAYINLSVVYYKIGRYADAIEVLKQALQVNPYVLTAYNKLGTTYIIRGAYSMAVDTFKKALDIDPRNASAQFNLGLAYFLTGDRNRAFEQYITLRDIDRERAEVLKDIIDY